MRVFAFEYFSGGGLAGQPLPPSLAREGDLMLRTLARELAEAGMEVIASRDPRLPPVPGCEALAPRPGEDWVELYNRGLAAAEAAWPTAPESDGILERLADATVDSHRILLGCRPDAVRLAASKRATAEALRERGVDAVPTYGARDLLPPLPGRWVVKPDDGAGGEDTVVVEDWGAAAARLAADPERWVAQPWLDGEPASLSLLCASGTARLLSCNRQEVELRNDRIALRAIEVNAVRDEDGTLARIAARIAATLPGLWGYVGVDLMLTAEGPVVLEINPRLTTSYCGLQVARGLNVAALVVGLLPSGVPPGAVTAAANTGVNGVARVELEASRAV